MTRVVWDFDGTIVYNAIDINFRNNLQIFNEDPNGKLHAVRRMNRPNPIVNPDDVTVIVTGRLAKHRDVTEIDLRRVGIDPANVDLIMFPAETYDHATSLAWKADTLNAMGADYYIDDDIGYLREITKHLTSTRAITTTDYYQYLNPRYCYNHSLATIVASER